MDGAIGVVFDNRQRLLLVKRRNVPVWVFPGGGIEKGKTPEMVVEREVFEESGYKVKIVKKIAEYKYKSVERKNHVFECRILSGDSRVSPESKEVVFLTLPKH